MVYTFMAPGNIISGAGALEEAGDNLQKMGKKALIVTDPTMVKLGNVARLIGILKSQGMEYAIADGINGEPDDGMILEGVSVFRQEGCDFFIALGGGSPMDAMKAIAVIETCGGIPSDYQNKSVTTPLKSMVAIPTTAGTGSEATGFTIITDRKTEVKMLLKGSALLPNLVVLDPTFTFTAPKEVTASTGVDALVHAIEAFTSRKAQHLSDTFAISACKRIFNNLKTVWENGTYEDGRTQMSLGALEAGIAFSNASVTLVHGMSRPIGALFHVPHGISNAILLEVCLNYATKGQEERFAQLSRACGFAGEGESDMEATGKLLEAISKLLKEIRIPRIADMGIDQEEFFRQIPKMAKDAKASGSPANTRREVTIEGMELLYQKLWEREVPLL